MFNLSLFMNNLFLIDGYLRTYKCELSCFFTCRVCYSRVSSYTRDTYYTRQFYYYRGTHSYTTSCGFLGWSRCDRTRYTTRQLSSNFHIHIYLIVSLQYTAQHIDKLHSIDPSFNIHEFLDAAQDM